MIDDRPHLLGALDGLQRRIGALIGARIEEQGIPILRGSEGRILGLISLGATRPTSLADGAWITKQAIGRRLAELQERGLVAMEPDPDDGRAVVVSLTPEGESTVARTNAAIAAVERDLADLVGVERYAAFRAVLADLAVPHRIANAATDVNARM